MNIKYYLFCFLPIALIAQDAPLFKKADNSYQQLEYADSLQTYKKIKHKDAAVWYNMGNAAYHMQDYLKATLYWLRAQKYGDATVFALGRQNMHYLHAKMGLSEPTLSDQVYDWFLLLTKKVSPLVWQLLFLGLWYLLFWLWIGCSNREKKRLYMGLVIMLLGFVVWPIVIAYHANKQQALVMQDDVAVYNGPNKSFYTVGTLKKGALVSVDASAKQWYKIDYDKMVGWVERASVTKI
ncbi:MAG: SH3 domain-containing protein [Candidatus Dependentiae bacterium]